MTASLRKDTSTLATWAGTILRALAAHGIDGAAVAQKAGIDPLNLQHEARVPRAALDRLWRLAVEATGNPAFGLEAPRYTSQTTFHALGYAVLASLTLKDAFERFVRFRRLVGEILQLEVLDVGDRYRFVIDVSAHPDMPYQAVDAIASMCVRQARFLHGGRPCNPLDVSFQHATPLDVLPYERLFRAPIRFDQPLTYLEFTRADMEDPLPAGNAELARGNEEVLLAFLARSAPSQLTARVRQAMLEAMPDGAPAKAAVARTLGMSARNLQRHLAQEGTSFKQLLNEARISIACSYIDEGRLSVTEIAFVVGFADTSTFSRAFKRWTGMSPRHWAGRKRA